jgi:hypothetical protein
MRSRKLRMAVALALPVIAAVLVPAGITGCDDNRRRHDTVIVAPQERHTDRVIVHDREVHRDEHHESQEHHDRD